MGEITTLHMEEQYGLQGAIVILAIAFGLYLIMRPFTTYLLRRRALELGLWTEQMHRQLEQERDSPLASLKWGLILFFTGVGLFVAFSPGVVLTGASYGIVAISTGLGFLVYYFCVTRLTQKP